jgi:hypothetical protein
MAVPSITVTLMDWRACFAICFDRSSSTPNIRSCYLIVNWPIRFSSR